MHIRYIDVLVVLSWSVVSGYCCMYLSTEHCPPKTSRNRCSRVNSSVICCNVSDFTLTEGLNIARVRWDTTTSLYVHNASLNVFNATRSEWSRLKCLAVVNGQIKKIEGQFWGNLASVNLSGNNLSDINLGAFEKLSRLTSLDLSMNNITKIPNITIYKSNFTLDISNNSHIVCHNIYDLMVKYQNTSRLHFINGNDTTCLSARSFHWFNSTDTMTLAQVELLTKTGTEDCPKQCTCKTYRTDFTQMHAALEVKLSVNCSNQNLTELPPLPPNTIYLDVSNNLIKSLKPLSTNECYSEVREFIADNNRIESIAILEGSKFIDNFAILSLRNNRIRAIPTYILSNAFDRTFHESRIVKFGGNELQCDCSTAQVKMWLINNKNYIEDHDEVLCDKYFCRVLDIDPSKICIYEKDWRYYIYYIIGAEIFLLLSLVSKVSYDYWVFKSFGYLPWPASRMPKLPCDWCFET